MDPVWVVAHEYQWRSSAGELHDEWKFLGAFADEASARAAVAHLQTLPGFQTHPDGFIVVTARLGHFAWEQGFVPGEEEPDIVNDNEAIRPVD